jgi:hypothetical protein
MSSLLLFLSSSSLLILLLFCIHWLPSFYIALLYFLLLYCGWRAAIVVKKINN